MALRWLSSLFVLARSPSSVHAMSETTFKRVQTQFIAAAIDPVHGEGMQSSSGNGTSAWGIWRVDPGPRGVRLGDYPRLSGGKAPAGWQFDKSDWWLEEHGLIMEKPDFPLPPGKYEVTGGREVTTILTVHEDERWELTDGAKLYDVTHLPCRAARYKPSEDGDGSPATADSGQFPVTPGGPMPPVRGCDKQVCRASFASQHRRDACADLQPPLSCGRTMPSSSSRPSRQASRASFCCGFGTVHL